MLTRRGPDLAERLAAGERIQDIEAAAVPMYGVAPTSPLWPARPDGAFYGRLGAAVRAIEPLTEADPVAVLAQLLVAFGSAIGRGPRLVIGSIRQHANLFAVIVGKSSKARKGTSWAHAADVLKGADEAWAKDRIKSGLSSGEGVIHAVRDPVVVQEPIREGGKRTGRIEGYQDVEQDPGESDKRLLVIESEFARTLKVAARKESILSAVLRDAWDTGHLSVLTRAPYTATGAHVSIIGHVTCDELRRELSAADSFNGFANRFLWLCVKRSKELPFGDRHLDDAVAGTSAQIATATRAARARGDDWAVTMDYECRNRWAEVYSALSADRPGLVGSVLGRAEAQVLRLALVYALADQAGTVRLPHLEAALALWAYVEASARVIFGDSLGDGVADELVRVLREAGASGMTRDELRNHFDRNLSAARMTQALGALAEHGLAEMRRDPPASGRGRPAERWFARAPNAENAKNAEKGTYGVNGVFRVGAAGEDPGPPVDDDSALDAEVIS